VPEPSGGQNMQITKQATGMLLGKNKPQHIIVGQKMCKDREKKEQYWRPLVVKIDKTQIEPLKQVQLSLLYH
jgi:hypothetical protein